MRNLMILAPLLSLFACGGADPAAACNDAQDAGIACYEEAYPATGTGTGTATGTAVDTCAAYENYEGEDADALIEYFDCQKTAWDVADCTTGESYLAAYTDLITTCTITVVE